MPRRRLTEAAVVLAVVAATSGCGARFRPAAPAAAATLQAAPTYSAALRVSVGGVILRGRAGAVVAFRRPDALRVEVAGPGGARLVAVASGGRLTAVFPAHEAVFRAAADAESFRHLLGVPLSATDVIDLLTGVAPRAVDDYRADWGPLAPVRVHARLPGGARLRVSIEDPQLGADLPAAAFEPPPHAGFREIGADEAQELWTR